MRGQILFSYALVAFATTAYSSPLVARTDEVEARSPYVVDGKAFNVGIVDVGKEFVERRKYIVARAEKGTVSKASATSKPGIAKPTGAAAPKATSKSGVAKATGATPSKATSKPGAAKATGAAASKASASKAGATAKPAAAKATTPADLPGCPAVGGAKASASKSGAAKATGVARRADKPLGCDPTKPQAKRADIAAADPIPVLLNGLFGGGTAGASPSGAAGGGDLLAGIANAGLVPRDLEA